MTASIRIRLEFQAHLYDATGSSRESGRIVGEAEKLESEGEQQKEMMQEVKDMAEMITLEKEEAIERWKRYWSGLHMRGNQESESKQLRQKQV